MIRKGGKGEEPASSNAPSLAWRRDGSCGFALPNEQPFGKGHSSPPKTHATTRVTDSSPPSARPGTPRGTARPVGATRTPRRTTRGRVKGIAIRRRLVVAPSSNVSCLYPPFSLASPYASSRRQCASHRCRAILRGSGMKGRSIDRYRDRDSESDLRSIDRVRQARRTAPAALQQQQPKALCSPCVSHHSIACAACFCHLAGKAKYVHTHTRASKRAAKDSHRRTYQRTRTRCMHACMHATVQQPHSPQHAACAAWACTDVLAIDGSNVQVCLCGSRCRRPRVCLMCGKAERIGRSALPRHGQRRSAGRQALVRSRATTYSVLSPSTVLRARCPARALAACLYVRSARHAAVGAQRWNASVVMRLWYTVHWYLLDRLAAV